MEGTAAFPLLQLVLVGSLVEPVGDRVVVTSHFIGTFLSLPHAAP